jgi:hypothetical protein
MKLIIKAAAILLVAGSLTGCKKFLEEKPYSFVAPENFYKTAADAELALTGVYDVLNVASIQGQGNHNMWGRGMHSLTSVGNDELIADNTATEVDYISYSNYTYGSQTPVAAFTWVFLYAGVNRANYLIQRVPAITMDENRKKEILAEAHLLRGLYYFYLGWLWGGVPVTTDPEPNITQPRNSLQEVMKLAEADFKQAYTDLPSRNPKTGRVNKYTAAGFLAKLYLYLGSCKENNIGAAFNFPLNSFDWVNKDEMYTSAMQYCQDIYTNSGYQLIRPYNYLFLAATEAEARNEQMMLVQAGPGGNSEYILASYLSGPKGNVATNGGTYGRLRPLKELYDKYNVNDGRRTHNMTGSLNTTVNFTTVNGLKYFTPDAINGTFSNYNLGKYREASPDSKTSRGIANWAGETDFGILRFGDIVLMYAELKFKKGDEPGARALLREIRLRACADDATKLTAVTTAYLKTDFMDELFEERSRELCGEGWRRFDLVRTNRLKQVVQSLKPIGSTMNIQNVPELQANFEDYKIWYPVPKREIELNPSLDQNPGYPKS